MRRSSQLRSDFVVLNDRAGQQLRKKKNKVKIVEEAFGRPRRTALEIHEVSYFSKTMNEIPSGRVKAGTKKWTPASGWINALTLWMAKPLYLTIMSIDKFVTTPIPTSVLRIRPFGNFAIQMPNT